MDEQRDQAQRSPGGRTDAVGEAAPAGLDAGGHEPAPPSEDAADEEARKSIQQGFDQLGATRSSDALWEAADRSADEQPAPGTPGDEAAETPGQ